MARPDFLRTLLVLTVGGACAPLNAGAGDTGPVSSCADRTRSPAGTTAVAGDGGVAAHGAVVTAVRGQAGLRGVETRVHRSAHVHRDQDGGRCARLEFRPLRIPRHEAGLRVESTVAAAPGHLHGDELFEVVLVDPPGARLDLANIVDPVRRRDRLDPATAKETAAAALAFVDEQLGERPVVAVVMHARRPLRRRARCRRRC